MKFSFRSHSKVRQPASLVVVTGTLIVAGFAAISVASPNFRFGGPFAQQSGRKTTDPPTMAKGKLGQELFLALDKRDLVELKALLKNGADPNSRNGLEFTPLFIAAASHQPDAMATLIEAGADPNADSSYGSALSFAAGSGNVPGAKLLLGHKVNPNPIRNDGINPMMMAAYSGAVPVIDDLAKLGVDVNTKDYNDSTALFYAIRAGNDPAALRLLALGADVKVQDFEGQTPLMAAAVNGRASLVKSLLDKGSDVAAKDSRGRTALILAVEYGDHPDVVAALLKGGADARALDGKGRSAKAIANARGFSGCVKLLGAAPKSPTRSPKQAVMASLKLIQGSMKKFSEMTACISCHQEGLARVVTGTARGKGYALDAKVDHVIQARVDGTVSALQPINEASLSSPEVAKQLPLVEINEVATLDSWLLTGMAYEKAKPTAGTAAMAKVLAAQQTPGGFWTFSVPRVPMQSSFFTFTALSIRSLVAYAPKESQSDTANRIRRAKAWLLKAPAQNSEDRASRLMGLKWAGATSAEMKPSIDAILKDQATNGGWAQLPGAPADAYATGQALYALKLGGLSPESKAYKMGVAYLLRTQDADGSWFVNKRAFPANNYFDAAFPHGQSQYSSFNGTCWAALALMEASPQNK